MAFCEARKRNCSDWAHSAIMGRRCINPIDHLETWEEQFIVQESNRLVEARSWQEMMEAERLAEANGIDTEANDFVPMVDVVTNNPAPIVDLDGYTIHLVYCDHYDHAYYTRSVDDGVTWQYPVDITAVLEQLRYKSKNNNIWRWTVIASGPGQGIQLERGHHAGRLIVPFWMASNENDPSSHYNSQVTTIYSDDSGKTWEAGSFVPFTVHDPNESKIIELGDGRLIMLSRTRQPVDQDHPGNQRAISFSNDGGETWSAYKFHPDIPEPMVMGSIARIGAQRLVYSLPDPSSIHMDRFSRVNLTLWLSMDDGMTWPTRRVIESGPTAYSDLAADPVHGLIYCLYEDGSAGGTQGPYNGISIVKVNKNWLQVP